MAGLLFALVAVDSTLIGGRIDREESRHAAAAQLCIRAPKIQLSIDSTQFMTGKMMWPGAAKKQYFYIQFGNRSFAAEIVGQLCGCCAELLRKEVEAVQLMPEKSWLLKVVAETVELNSG